MVKKASKKSAKSVKQMNETGRRSSGDRRQKEVSTTQERRSVQRRRQIDPTTCERDYTNEEVEFMQALDQYKRDSGRMFPTCSEILEVLRKLGYSKTQCEQITEKCESLVSEIEADLDSIEI